MRIAIDVSPLSSGHRIRGVGFYLKNLLEALEKYHPEHEYIEFSEKNKLTQDFDVIHYPYFDPFSLTLPFFGKKNTVVTIHDLTPLVLPNLFPIGPRGKVMWFLQKQALGKVRSIITDSISSKKDVEKILKIDSKKVHKVYLAAGEHFRAIQDKSVLQAVAKKYNLPESFALYVGDATPNKNLPTLTKAILRTTIPLVMVGKTLTDESVDISNAWAKDIQEIRQQAKSNKIYLLGFVPDEDLVALYNLASVFVMPSLYEGFGLPVLEAMQCGCPVVASDRGSLREVAGTAAYIIDPTDAEAIAHAIQKVKGDKQFAKKLSHSGLEQAKKFSWKKTASQTIAIYKQVVLH
jgi:glycosyltransferase involved in cell wall biosynthesis